MKELGNYTSGARDGLWKSWYKNGKLNEMGAYKDGFRDGIWKFWHENGKLKSSTQYYAEKIKKFRIDWKYKRGRFLNRTK